MASDIKGKISQINGKPLVDIGLRNDIGDLSLVNGTLVDFVNSKPSLGQVRDEIGKVIGDAPEAFDTLKEIADWIGEHGTDFTKLSEKVDTKLDKITSIASYNRLYGVTQSGSQRTYNISKSPQDSAIPQYKSTGQLQVNDPIDSKDVANKQYVLNTAVNKLTTTQKAGSIVYGRSSTGTEEGVNYRSSAEYGYDLVYRDGNGRAQIKDPANDLDISNKKYVDESLEKKVDKVAPGSKWQLYGVGSETTQLPNGATISTTHQALPNTVINRDGNGRAEIESPVTDLNIVNKKYVDTSLKTKLDKVEITSGKYKA